MSSYKSTPFTHQSKLEYLIGVLGEIKRLVRVVEEYVRTSDNTSKKGPTPTEFNNGEGHKLGVPKENVVGGKRIRTPRWETSKTCLRCEKKHLGVCHWTTSACFKCGRLDHKIRNCPTLKKD